MIILKQFIAADGEVSPDFAQDVASSNLSVNPVKDVAVGLHQQTAAFSRHQLAVGFFWKGELHVAEGPIALRRLSAPCSTVQINLVSF